MLKENEEIVIWGKPAGSNDPLDERVLSTQCKTVVDIEKIKEIASKDGWHSFRVVKMDMTKKPDFLGQ